MNIYLKNLYKSKIWEAVIIILALFSIYSLLIILPYRTNENDFAHYYVSSRLLLEGKNPYSTPMKPLYDQYGLHFDEAIPFATNPPLLLLLFLPFTIFSPKIAYMLWLGIQIGSLIIILILIYKLLGYRMTSRGFRFFCAGAIGSATVYWHFVYSQIQLPLFALLLIGFSFMTSGRSILACITAMFAGLLKLYPLYFIPWFIWHGGKRLSQRLKLVLICLALTCILVGATGVDLWWDFFQRTPILFKAWTEGHARNYSIPSLVINLGIYANNLPVTSQLAKLTWTFAMVFGYILLIIPYIICWRSRKKEFVKFRENEFALLCAAILVGSVIAWGHYLVFLFFSFALAAVRTIEKPTSLRIGGLFVSWLTLNNMQIWEPSFLTDHPMIKVLINYLPLFGIIWLGWFFANELINELRLIDSINS